MPRPSSPRRSLERTPRSNNLPLEANLLVETETAIAAVRQQPTVRRSVILCSTPRSNSLLADCAPVCSTDVPTTVVCSQRTSQLPMKSPRGPEAFPILTQCDPTETERNHEVERGDNVNLGWDKARTRTDSRRLGTINPQGDLSIMNGLESGNTDEHSLDTFESDKHHARDSFPGAFAVGETCESSASNNSNGTLIDMQAGSFRSQDSGNKLFSQFHKETGEKLNSSANLAEAVVAEEEPDMPDAVEFDPDAKPVIVKCCQTVWLVTFCCIVIAAVGGALYQTRPPHVSSGLLRRESIFNVIVSGDQDHLLDHSSDHFRVALEWIADTDPLRLPTNHSGVLQRFVLVHFYLSTSTKSAWGTCSQQLESEGPCINIAGNSWLSEVNECLWIGVMCNSEGQVILIDCPSFGLTGTIADSIVLLPELRVLHLPNNELEGQMPQSLPTKLTLLSLRNNSITGRLSRGLAALSDVRLLDLSENFVSGSLPSWINELSSLTEMGLEGNLLRGHVPLSLFELGHLTTLKVARNYISGTISSEIKFLSSLEVLNLESNVFSGTIPTELFELSSLRKIHLGRNYLDGHMPTGLHNLSMLEVLDLKDNNLSGYIGSEATVPEALRKLLLSGNNLVGSIPQAFCIPRQHGWDFLEADCKSDEKGRVELQCICCTKCCDSDGGRCEEIHF